MAETFTCYSRPVPTPYSELQIGDVVRLGGLTYDTATVKRVTPDSVTFFRPFVHHDHYETTQGIFCYVGIEEFTISTKREGVVLLVERQHNIR